MGTKETQPHSTPGAPFLTLVLQQQQLLGAGCAKHHLMAPPGAPRRQVGKEGGGLHHVCPLQHGHQWQPLIQHVHRELGWGGAQLMRAHPSMPWQPGLCPPWPPAVPHSCGGTHLGGDEVLGGVSPAQVHGQHHTLALLAAGFLTHLEQVEVASLGGLQRQRGVLSAPRAGKPSPSPAAGPLPALPGSPGCPGTAGRCGQHSSAPAGGR